MAHASDALPQSGAQEVESQSLDLTVLMPCLNEADTVGTCVRKARTFLETHGIRGEVLVADNGSTDGSREIAEREGARVIRIPDRGYGKALLAGIDAARGRFVVMGDADDTYDFLCLGPFLEELRAGHDLVMGNRFEGGIEAGAMPALHRYLGNPVLSRIGRLLFQSPVRDFHCGLRAFRKDAVEELGLTAGGMEFASEMVVKATLNDLRITEVPITLAADSRERPSHLRTWRDGWRHLRFLLLFSPRWLFLYPGALLMLVGLASMLWLLPGARRVAGVGLDVNTLVYSGAAIICGFQAMAFGLFAKVYAMSVDLLPEDSRVRALTSRVTLEAGLVTGLVVLAAGLAGSLYAVGFWGQASFGPLDPRQSLRIVAPSATGIILGLQIVFSSFFLGVLELDRA